MDVSALHAVIEHVGDCPEARRQGMTTREDDGGVEKGVLEVGVALQELLTQESGVLDVPKEDEVQRVVLQMRKDDGLHGGGGGSGTNMEGVGGCDSSTCMQIIPRSPNSSHHPQQAEQIELRLRECTKSG